MIAHAKSKYKVVENLSDIPVLGGFIVVLFSALPGLFLSIYSSWISEIPGVNFETYICYSYVIWNVFLWTKKIKIYIFFIPGWLLWFGLGIARYFQYI